MPAMAPHVAARFHQTERIRTGNTAEALTVSDHKNSFSGSAGAATASHPATKVEVLQRGPRRADAGGVGAGSARSPCTMSSERMLAPASRPAASAAMAAATAPASDR